MDSLKSLYYAFVRSVLECGNIVNYSNIILRLVKMKFNFGENF